MDPEPIRTQSNTPIYYGVLAAITIVIVILLISIPSTKKKYTSGTGTGNGSDTGIYVPPELRDINSILEDGKIIKMRSIATGEYYKNDTFNLSTSTLIFEYNIQAKPPQTPGLPLIIGDGFTLDRNRTRLFSPYFQREPYNMGAPLTTGLYTEKLDLILLQKYNTTPKPADLSQQDYDELIATGWYLIPLNAIRIPIDGQYPFTKPFLVGNDSMYVGFIARLSNNFPSGVNNSNVEQMYADFINNTDPVLQAEIDDVLFYNNVFKFVRSYEDDNAFLLENVLTPDVSFNVNRHSLIRPDNAPERSDVVNGEYADPNLEVGLQNILFNPTVAGPYPDKLQVSFYIESAGFVNE